ncbi:MAG: thioredoxin domain-containing protein, partial [Patescibacteria group bacterium]
DHIRGNPDAAVKIVEYSDLECPFCKRFHSTMQQVVEEYGKDGRVAWVYRHFPLDALHSKARKEAEATECANELGGNTAFWTYIDKLIAITPSNNQLDPNQLPVIAGDIGLNREAFQTCLDAGKFADRVSADLSDAQAAGGSGTPYSIAIAKNGEKFPINGAQPYEEVKRIIELALQAK